MFLPIEAQYPVSFRETQAKELGTHLHQHNSVVLVGMKRVGISNFLRFFLTNPHIPNTYVKSGLLLFVHVDLNDLIDTSPQAFWILVLKRLIDAIEISALSVDAKRKADKLFNDSIQVQDLFLTLESVRRACRLIADEGFAINLFLVRFDRLQETVTPELFANLLGLKESLGTRLSYVFTSYRPLTDLRPGIFTKAALGVFARDMYLTPASTSDMKVILQTFLQRYQLRCTPKALAHLLDLAGGHVQYLQLSLLKLCDLENVPDNKSELLQLLTNDEEIRLLGEEIMASLTVDEQIQLKDLVTHKTKSIADNSYLRRTGLVTSEQKLFSPLFETAVRSKQAETTNTELSKKEHALYQVLQEHIGQVVERDTIIETVWPEQIETGVTDWAVDRLVARLRQKLKDQHSPYAIVTIVSRGYKLTKEEL
ncbi:MAG TPA: helix-turn-helix domain-containing protein [Vitreimonas sp.]|nr:helix-turn-helix domain-containing protein [Vitreimonas sp.]